MASQKVRYGSAGLPCTACRAAVNAQGCRPAKAALNQRRAACLRWRQRSAAGKAALNPRRAALLPAAPLCRRRVKLATPVPTALKRVAEFYRLRASFCRRFCVYSVYPAEHRNG